VPERFALFTIIVLGESVVAVALGTAHNDWRAASATTAALGFVSVACLWWVYLDRSMAGGLSSRTGSMQIYTRIHIPLLGALTAVGAGVPHARRAQRRRAQPWPRASWIGHRRKVTRRLRAHREDAATGRRRDTLGVMSDARPPAAPPTGSRATGPSSPGSWSAAGGASRC
jgi:hypothetical protein